VPGGGRPGGWAAWTTGSAPFTGLHWLAADGFFRYQVFQNPAYDPMSFNFGSDLLFSLHAVGPLLDAIDPDLRPLHAAAPSSSSTTLQRPRHLAAQLDQLLRERGGVHGAPER